MQLHHKPPRKRRLKRAKEHAEKRSKRERDRPPRVWPVWDSEYLASLPEHTANSIQSKYLFSPWRFKREYGVMCSRYYYLFKKKSRSAPDLATCVQTISKSLVCLIMVILRVVLASSWMGFFFLIPSINAQSESQSNSSSIYPTAAAVVVVTAGFLSRLASSQSTQRDRIGISSDQPQDEPVQQSQSANSQTQRDGIEISSHQPQDEPVQLQSTNSQQYIYTQREVQSQSQHSSSPLLLQCPLNCGKTFKTKLTFTDHFLNECQPTCTDQFDSIKKYILESKAFAGYRVGGYECGRDGCLTIWKMKTKKCKPNCCAWFTQLPSTYAALSPASEGRQLPSASSAAATSPAPTASSASAISSDANTPLSQAFPKQWCPITNTWIPRQQNQNTTNSSHSTAELLEFMFNMLKSTIGTRMHIPYHAQRKFATVAEKLLKAVVSNPKCLRSHYKFAALFKYVLCTPKSIIKQSKNRKHVAVKQFVKERLDKYLSMPEREINDFFAKHQPPTQSSPSAAPSNPATVDPWFDISKENAERACKLAKLGYLRKAAQSLFSSGVHAMTDAVYSALKDKNPWGPPIPLVDQPVSRTKAYKSENVIHQINSFFNSTSPGPDGVRIAYFKDILNLRSSSSFTDSFTDYCNLMGNGSFPAELAPLCVAANLTPLKKKDNGIRPVAVSSVIYRLVGKLEFKTHCKEGVESLRPSQLGVGVHNACEAICHAAQFLMHNVLDPGYSMIALDFKNAFNTIDRRVMMEELQRISPGASPFVKWSYCNPSPLLVRGKDPIMSCTGVRQGDPLGPYLFALTAQKLIDAINHQFAGRLKMNVWYLDDGTIICKSELLPELYNFIVDFIPQLGLELHPAKCVVYAKEEQVEWDSLPIEVQKTTLGIKLLGSPIGTPHFIIDTIQSKFVSVCKAVDSLQELNQPQIILPLLRQCFALPKINYILRTTESVLMMDALQIFDTSVSSFPAKWINWKFGCNCQHLDSTNPLNNVFEFDPIRSIWSLPFNKGGFNLPEATPIADIAFYASVKSTQELQREICGHARPVPSLLQLGLTEEELDSLFEKNGSHLQKALLDVYYTRLHCTTMQKLDDRGKVLLKSRSEKGASWWLSASPSDFFDSTMSTDEFTALLTYHSNVPFVNAPEKCLDCGKNNDCYGDHAVSCIKNGQVGPRHNRIQNTLLEYAKQGQMHVRREEFSNDEDNKRMGDVVIEGYKNGRTLWIDVSVVNSMAITYFPHAKKDVLGACLKRIDEKRTKYRYDIEIDNKWFEPVVFDTFGACSRNSHLIFKEIAANVTARKGIKYSDVLKKLARKMSLDLQTTNGQMLASRMLPPKVADGW